MQDATMDVTALLGAWGRGDRGARDRVLPILYGELRILARERLRREGPGHTLEATALVHELYLKLAGQHRASWHSRLHFLRVAAQMMRRILIDHARIGSAQKRGQGLKRVELEDMAIELDEAVDILALDEALARLAAEDARAAEVVELKFFAGLGVPEIAEALGVSEPTIKRDWARARAWLWAELREDGQRGAALQEGKRA